VTGGTRGLGRELSLELGRAGYNVLAIYRQDEDAADELRSQFSSLGIAGECRRIDLCQPAARKAIEEAVGPVGDTEAFVLVHGAVAPMQPKALHLFGWEDFEEQLAPAVQGAWACSLALLKHLTRSKRGRIVNVLSRVIHEPASKGFAPYLMAKYALQGFTQALARDYPGIGVFSVSPGFMDTDLTRAWDERTRATFSGKARPVSEVAARIRELVEAPATPGRGEDHSI
jgi:3-oxoacyl-[acyl-carrier protein] reductase